MKKILLTCWICVFCLGLTRLWAQERKVSGRVTDAAGETLVGVTVLVKGTTNGTITDIEGNYTIPISSDDATLTFSFIGMLSKDVQVGTQSMIDVSMQFDTDVLEEVVVVGYGTQRREAVTGSVSSLGGADLREIPAANISSSMQGRLPGVAIQQTSSEPGSTMQIRIRGVRSLTASNDPLIVLDGIPFPGSLNDINPNDVKSLDILKDASATAIYGSRGANGVVLITTYKGVKGQKPQISYNSFVGTKKLFAKYPMMDSQKLLRLRSEAGEYTVAGTPGSEPQFGPDEDPSVNTDFQDLLFKDNALFTSHDIGVRGGTETGAYTFGVSYFHDESLVPTQAFDRYAIRGALDQNLGDYIKVGFSTNNVYSLTQGNQVGIGFALSTTPMTSPYNADGSLKRTVSQVANDDFVLTEGVVNSLGDRWLSETRNFATYNNLYGEVQIPGVEGLRVRSNFGINFRQSNGGGFTGRGVNSFNQDQPSSASVSNSHTYDWTNENMLIYDRDINKHHVNFTGLYSASRNQFNRSRITADDIPEESFQFYNLGQAAGEIQIDPDDQQYILWGLQSLMGRVQYEYNDRYMLTATLRSDGSSRLAEGNKWNTYSALSVGWNLGNENFLNSISLINRLKLRLGYGETSNQAVDPYSTLGSLTTTPYNHGDATYVTGFYVNTLPNATLGWEYSSTVNVGVDFAILNNRLSGTIEYYETRTKDILLNLDLPPTSGVDSYVANIGETKNIGFEMSLNGIVLDNRNGWTVEAGLNFFSNRNELVALADGQEIDEGNQWFVGDPINVIYDYERVGLWQEGDPHLEVLEPEGAPGMIKVKYTGDYNEAGVPTRPIGPDDRQVRQVDPEWQGGFNTRVSYKGFDLSIIGFYQHGGTIISSLYGTTGNLNLLTGRLGNVDVDYWTPENTGAKYPGPTGPRSAENLKYSSTLGYFDASFLKIRTITLGYDLERLNFIQNSGISKMRLYFTAQNPFVLFSPYHSESGLDPESNSRGDENQAINSEYPERLLIQTVNAPRTRNYIIGLNLTF